MAKKKQMKRSTRRLLDSFGPPKWSKDVLDAREEWKHLYVANGYSDEELLEYLTDGYESPKWSTTPKESAFITGQQIGFVKDVYDWWEGQEGFVDASLCDSFNTYREYKVGIKQWSLAELMDHRAPHNSRLSEEYFKRVDTLGVRLLEICRELNRHSDRPITIRSLLALLKRHDVPYVDVQETDAYDHCSKLSSEIDFENHFHPSHHTASSLVDPTDKDEHDEYLVHPRALRVLEKLKRFKDVGKSPWWRKTKLATEAVR
jgi:hypothetical protein